MRTPARSLPLVALALTLAACQREAETADAAAEPVVLQTSMTNVVKPQTEVVLNILIAALTEPPDPAVDPSKLSDGDWATMETAAAALRDEAVRLRDGRIAVVAAPGDALDGEEFPGAPTAADVQARIDASPDGFAEHAEEMRLEAERWLTAIDARDTATMWRVALELDPVCVDCHEVFWSGEDEHDHEDEDR